MRLLTIPIVAMIILSYTTARAEDLIPYEAHGWKYLDVPHSDSLTSVFFETDFDDSGWQTGQAAFGSTDGYCPLAKTIHTSWPGNSELLLRRTFYLSAPPAPCDSQLVIYLAVDNNATVYVNGEQVFSAFSGGCPNRDDYSVPIPGTILNAGENLLAFRATDTGWPSFADVRVEMVAVAGAEFIDATTPLMAGLGQGQSVAWADYDGDNDQDLYVVHSHDQANKLFRNDGSGIFSDATTGVLGGGAYSLSAAWGDYDDDGDLDLYIGKHDGPANRMLRNDGLKGFVDATVGPLGHSAYTTSASWADYDLDKDLDLFLASWGGANRLLRNDGQGQFTDVTGDPIGNTGNGSGSAWGDFDNDGDPDLFVTNLSGACRLFRNDGAGVFVDVESGPLAGPANAQGVAWGDYDNDRDLDLYIAGNSSNCRLLRNEGGGFFSDATSGPLGSGGQGRGVAWGDYDNDGDLDLCVAKDGSPSQLLRNDDGQFADVTPWPLSRSARSQGVAWSDHDDDGDLDLYVTRFNGANLLLRNMRECDKSGHWVHVKLNGTASNSFGVGARISILAGGLWQMREVQANSGYLSFNSIVEEFGLGGASAVELLVVKWPSGAVQALTDITPVDRLITIDEASTAVALEMAPVIYPVETANYPDPFAGTTKIPYDVVTEGLVQIEIYDVQGRLVRSLVNSVQSRGDHMAIWDGRDRAGAEVSSGIYYYKIEGPGLGGLGKMVVTR